MAETLISGLFSEMNRVRDLKKLYEQLPDGAGCFGAIILSEMIGDAEKAISEGDTIAMLLCYDNLRLAE